jgi:hypothetical protein
MGLYDVGYSNFGNQTLPPDKRFPKMIAWVSSLLTPMQYLRDLLFDSYKLGNTSVQYAPGTYNKGDRVKYNKAIYESLVASNTAAPSDLTKWVKVQDNYVGLDKRIQYNGQKLVLEFALNEWFSTVFRQPNLVSDIFISLAVQHLPVFRSGPIEDVSSTVAPDRSSEFVMNDYQFGARSNFTINIPLSVYNALDPIAGNRDGIVRNFVDKYIPAGILYNIATY